MKKLFADVLGKIRPKNEERREAKNFYQKVIKAIEKEGYQAAVQGSMAKNTWVSGDHDVDVFVFFGPEVSREELEKKGLQVGKSVIKKLGGKPEIAFAEHPYARADIGKFTLDIVPCYKLKSAEKIQSAVDRTPFHTAFVKSNLDRSQRNEVRLLKQFMKGVGVYSAKEKVRGFSGYLCELLIFEYGTFENLIKVAKDWNYGKVTDVTGQYKSARSVKRNFKHSLIVIDPTDRNRNVAAALDDNNFERFVYACEEFLAKPSIKFFFPDKPKLFSKEDLKSKLDKHGEIVLIKFKTPRVVEDILYSQLRRSVKSLREHLAAEEYEILDSDIYSNGQSFMVLEFKTLELPNVKKLLGPPIESDNKFQDAFTKKYRKYKPWVDEGRWFVEVPREYTNGINMLEHLLEDPRKVGVGKYCSDCILKDYKIITGDEILKEYRNGFAEFFTNYLTKKKPWEW
jgi:tRNA nucleotidyltransferase (CCA-adding enzyme)